MRLIILAAGTRGDVAPYTGLGRRLQEAGHVVTLAAHGPFRDLVVEAGLGFHEVPGDIREVVQVPVADRPPSRFFLNRRLPQLRRYLHEVADGVIEATADADAVLVTGAVPFGYAAAQARGLPSVGVFLQPFEPSGAYPSPVTNSARSLGPWVDRALGTLLLDALWPYTQAANHIRRSLGRPARGARATRRQQAADGWPVFHGVSPAVLPRPADWRPGLEVGGYWWPHEPAGWAPPAELDAFLAAGPPPVLISFGSMAAGAGPWLRDAVVGAVRAAGVRAIVQAGWADLDVGSDDGVLTIGAVPHPWLFPRVAAVVHHAGAGTTAAAVRAGVPSVATPVYADQPLWAHRLAVLGVGRAVPFQRLTAERLGTAIRDVVTDAGYRDRAAALARRVALEDGAAPVVEAVDRLDRR